MNLSNILKGSNRNISHVLIFLYLVQLSVSVNFNRNYTGVSFLPFVRPKNEAGNYYSRESSYTPEYTRVMMQVIAQKFSRVLTYGMGYGHSKESYVVNETYYNGIYVEGHTAEAAAAVNRQKGTKSLTILQAIWKDDEFTKVEVQLALEATQKAHNFNPGTVEGIVFTNWYIPCDKRDAKRNLKYYRMIKKSPFPDLLVGTLWKCEKLVEDISKQENDEHQVFIKLINESDFIICNQENERQTPFEKLTNKLLNIRETFTKVNPHLHVMARTMWKVEDSDEPEELKNFKSYWEAMNDWSTKNKFEVFLDEAIQNLDRRPQGGYGWWKLSSNANIKQVEGYIEHSLENIKESYGDVDTPGGSSSTVRPHIQPKPDTPDQGVHGSDENPSVKGTPETSPGSLAVIIPSSVISAIIFLVLCAFLVYKFINTCSKHSKEWSNSLIEFENGLQSELLPQNAHEIPCYEALKLPFDTAFEMSEDQVSVDRETILGNDPFCKVCKADILSMTKERIPVAFKMAEYCTLKATKEMMDQVKILIYIRGHPNIVTLMGTSTNDIHWGKLSFAMELCSLGPLDKYLRDQKGYVDGTKVLPQNVVTHYNKRFSQAMFYGSMLEIQPTKDGVLMCLDGNISIQCMIRWSYEISNGMEYLEKKCIIHGRLAANKVLLSSNRTAKITGFNLKRQMLETAKFMKTGKRPPMWQWMSFETLRKSEFSYKSDVWSFGVTMWEIFSSGGVPYAEKCWTQLFVDQLESGFRLEAPLYASSKVFDIINQCWNKDPNVRPKFADLQELLNLWNGQTQSKIASVEIF